MSEDEEVEGLDGVGSDEYIIEDVAGWEAEAGIERDWVDRVFVFDESGASP